MEEASWVASEVRRKEGHDAQKLVEDRRGKEGVFLEEKGVATHSRALRQQERERKQESYRQGCGTARGQKWLKQRKGERERGSKRERKMNMFSDLEV